VDVPVRNINQAGFGLIVAVISGAFYYIFVLINEGDNRAFPALFTGFAINSRGYIYVAVHNGEYAALLLQVVGLNENSLP
jgi:nicotinamide riboside transporter PnuC